MGTAFQERYLLAPDFTFSSKSSHDRNSSSSRQTAKSCEYHTPLLTAQFQSSLSLHHQRWASKASTSLDACVRAFSMLRSFRETRQSKFSKRWRDVKLVVRVLSFFKSRRRQQKERRKQVYAALLSLGVRLFLLTQADRISMLRALWKEQKGLFDQDSFTGGGGGRRGLGGKFGGSGGDDNDFSTEPRSSRTFLLKFLLLCSALLGAALTFVVVLSPASVATLSWLLDCSVSLALVLSAGLLSLWMLRMAVAAAFGIFKSCIWLFNELKKVLSSLSSWFNTGGEAAGTVTILVLSVPAVVYASLPANRPMLHRLMLRAQALVLSLARKLENVFHHKPSRSAATFSCACSRVRNVFKRSR